MLNIKYHNQAIAHGFAMDGMSVRANGRGQCVNMAATSPDWSIPPCLFAPSFFSLSLGNLAVCVQNSKTKGPPLIIQLLDGE